MFGFLCTNILEKWKLEDRKQTLPREHTDENIHSFKLVGTTVSLWAKKGWNKVVYRHRSIFLRWFTSLHIRSLGTGNISSNPRLLSSTSSFLSQLLPFSSLSKGFRASVGTWAVQYAVSKNVLRTYLAVLLVKKENNAFQERRSCVRMLILYLLDCDCFSINVTLHGFIHFDGKLKSWSE